MAGMINAKGLLMVNAAEGRLPHLQAAHAILAAPKMPNLRASLFLAGLGGLKACQIRMTKAAI